MSDYLYDIFPIDEFGRMARYIKVAARAALRSRHHQHRLGAVLVRGGKIISIGYNFSHVHAESTVLNRAWRGGTDSTLVVVVRIRRDGSFGISRPCAACVAKLINAGVRKVIYTDSDGEFKVAKLPREPVSQTNIKLQSMLWYKKGTLDAKAAICI